MLSSASTARGFAVITSDTAVVPGVRPMATTRFMMSRSETIPVSTPSRSTGRAPILCSIIKRAASRTVRPASME